MRLSRGVGALLPAGAVLAVLAVLAGLLLPPDASRPVTVLADLGLLGALTFVVHHTSRVPGVPPAAARFWVSLARALLVYAIGMAVDLAALLTTSVSGRSVSMYGAQLVYPVAGVFTMYAVFRYPTVTHSRSQKLRVGLDAGIVLVGTAAFIWYFTVSSHWAPDLGWLSLSETLALPVTVLVAGFGVLRVALVGAGLLTRPTLACYAACITLSGVATTLPVGQEEAPIAPTVLLLLAQLSSLTGAVLQHQASVAGTVPPLARRDRPFTVLPYGASAAAFGLLVAVVGPGLDWRRGGVLAGTGVLLVLVATRQLAALHENNRLLTQNRALTEQLRHQAWHDELTGLANRASFSRHVDEAIERFTATGDDTALLLIDLDGFKAVNDTFGHVVGDQLLCDVAGRLTREAGDDAVVCRLGGDEFVVLTGQTGGRAAGLASRLVQAVAVHAVIGGNPVRVGASIGIAAVSDAPGGAADLLRRADTAMYAVKSAGKNSWRLSDTPAPAPAPVS
ncbi:GGDEF domain-containing protein [Dactylosporangium sp. NPDC006015]|uniref:GGDEF domain-containing protein n=1 Tax=Dactylosporangium sp. NPDC006015 TaxID=3154576 RepID=UPI0033A33A9D